jgi:phenylpropionate dioxygenase-like ring-hydroxylating dioxygenase large terminal subunit
VALIEYTRHSAAVAEVGLSADEMDRVLAAGATLPAPFYTSEAIARLEDELIWRRAWQVVAVEPELRKVGDYVTSHINGFDFKVPIVIVRDEELKIRAFINVCRHRAHYVATGHGNRKTLQCTYHGWVYGLNGCLRGVPRQEEGGLPPFEQLGLYPLPVETWAGYVFVSLDPAESLGDFLGEFPQVLTEQGFEFPFAAENVDPDHTYVREEWENWSGSNWKAMEENNIECYHCPTTHTHSFSDMYEVAPNSYSHVDYDRGVYHTTWYQDGVAGRLGLADRSGPPEYQFYFLFPNMFFGGGKRTAESAGFSRRMPHTVDETRTVGVRYTLPTAGSYYPDEEIQRELEEAGRLTGEEDREVVARVQDGLRSGLYEYGYTLPESERNMRHFYGLVWQSLRPAFS